MEPSTERAQLIGSLSQRIDEVLGSLVPRGTRCALVDYPNHSNTGDAAIWLGARASLRRLGARVVYQCEWRSYDPQLLAASLGSGTILINGGGNFGDLWPDSQRLRERVLRDFPRTRTIQLPQSIWFEKREALDGLRRLCEAHADFTLLVREHQSLEIGRQHFAVPTLLCPDLALALGPLKRPIAPQRAVVWLARTDRESLGLEEPEAAADVERLDWITAVPNETRWSRLPRLARRWNRRFHKRLASEPGAARRLRRRLEATHTPLARGRLGRGCHILSRGRAVATDRLHGHLLCLLLGIPHAVMDNSYGKVSSLYRAWTSESDLAHWADSPRRALELARSLAAAEE